MIAPHTLLAGLLILAAGMAVMLGAQAAARAAVKACAWCWRRCSHG